MSSPLLSLEPKLLWRHFDDIRKTPRPSKHEEKIIEHILSWAGEKGFEVRRDDVGNVVVAVPATPGHENAPTIVLQGHVDMVCEKNSDVEHDFMNDPLDVYVDGDWVKARGTTLGSDNGVGVAAGMAITEDPESVHGPLELLLTIDEETGLTGAMGLDASIINGTIMINLDTEEDESVYFGCAGGADSTATFPIARRRAGLDTAPFKLAVTGLRGGHSGVDIHENRANAIKLAVRVLLKAIDDGVEVDLVSMEGGSKHNAIPREAFAVIRLPKDQKATFEAILPECQKDFEEEFSSIDPDLKLKLEALDDTADYQRPMNVHHRDRLLQALNGLPHGVLAMSREVPGLVESSNNVAVINTEDSQAVLTTSHRSSVTPALLAIQGQVASTCKLGGAEVQVHDGYPGWKPNPDSPIVKKSVEVYEKLFNVTPELKAIHAGLECGLLIEKKPGMDVVSIGPEIKNAHSPDEMVQISSVQKFYRHLRALLEELA